MKSCAILFIFILVILPSASKAQIQVDTTHHYPAIDTTDFFPMQIGNCWEYKCSTEQNSDYREITVLGDTLMPNGKRYVQFHEEYYNIGPVDDEWYYRKDSNAVYLYTGYLCCPDEQEYKIFDLTPGLKDSTVWEMFRGSRDGHKLGRGVRIYYTWHPWFKQPVEARLFTDVDIDTVNNYNGWGPIDNSPLTTLLQGIGIAKISWVACEQPYYLQGAIVNGKKFGTITSVENKRSIIPNSMTIQAYPNPFNSTVRLNIDLKSVGMTELMVFNILGQKVATIFEGYKPSGNFKFSFNADHLSSGVYFVLLKQDRLFCKEKIILLK